MTVGDGSSVPAGWYPDPADVARLRRWDGQNWTADVVLPQPVLPVVSVPAAPPTVAAPPPATPTPPPYQPSAPTAAEPAPGPAPGQPASAQASPAPASPKTVSTEPAPPEPAPAEPASPEPASAAGSGPISIPDWANLPGLTLPPDLSAFAGFSGASVLKQPKFDDPAMFDDPLRPSVASPVLPPPKFEEAPDSAESLRFEPASAEAAPQSLQKPAVGYAPPPVGSQYSAPPPPGAAYTPPTAGVALPPSALPLPPAQASPVQPSSVQDNPVQDNPVQDNPVQDNPVQDNPVQDNPVQDNPVQDNPARARGDRPTGIRSDGAAADSRRSAAGRDRLLGSGTLGVWMLAALPLLQFAVVYAVFGVLAQPLIPGIQWGILVIPALFSLLFAAADRKTLLDNGHDETPNPVLGILAPLYLIARVAVIGPKSVAPLVAWILLQAAVVVGVFVLLPTVLAAAISSS